MKKLFDDCLTTKLTTKNSETIKGYKELRKYKNTQNKVITTYKNL